MVNSFITHLQIFGIGFSFGFVGPCFLSCAPILLTFVAGSKRGWKSVLKDILTFLTGRLIAYIALGFLAGLSGAALRYFTSPVVSQYFQPLAGAVTLFFAVIVLFNRDNFECSCKEPRVKFMNYGGVFMFGLLVGLAPCAPLLALLFDVALISKGALDGMLYAFSFGFGTFVSGLITISIIAGILTRLPATLIKSEKLNVVFKVVCALLLAILGIALILKGYNRF